MYQFPTQRPRFLKLSQIRFCQNAWLSALHRITGALLIATLLIYLLLLSQVLLNDLSLHSLQTSIWIKWLNTLFWISLYFHWLSGLKHLLSEHFLSAHHYQRFTSKQAATALLHAWWLGSVVVIWNFLI